MQIGVEEINRFGPLSGQISQHQREGISASHRNGKAIFSSAAKKATPVSCLDMCYLAISAKETLNDE